MNEKPTRAAIYARVSTNGQTVDTQLRQLRELCIKRGIEVAEEYIDAGVSGSKGRDKRPNLDRMLKDAVRGEFSLVVCWAVDRLGRSVQHLVEVLSEIHGAGCDLLIHQQGLDTRTPAGKAMFQMLGVFSEFEVAIIKERVKAGLDRAKAKGVRLGKPRLEESPEGAEKARQAAELYKGGLGKISFREVVW